jgi:hypothetical protein
LRLGPLQEVRGGRAEPDGGCAQVPGVFHTRRHLAVYLDISTSETVWRRGKAEGIGWGTPKGHRECEHARSRPPPNVLLRGDLEDDTESGGAGPGLLDPSERTGGGSASSADDPVPAALYHYGDGTRDRAGLTARTRGEPNPRHMNDFFSSAVGPGGLRHSQMNTRPSAEPGLAVLRKKAFHPVFCPQAMSELVADVPPRDHAGCRCAGRSMSLKELPRPSFPRASVSAFQITRVLLTERN